MTDNQLFLPAEWHPQGMIQLTWPHIGTDWADCLDDITETFLQMAEVITRHERLLIVAPDADAVEATLRKRLTAQSMRQVILVSCPTNDTWARDHGAITLISSGEEPPRLLDFRFNGWGEKFPADLDNAITRHLAGSGVFAVPVENHDDFVLEGGSIESDGKGTVFTTSTCLLAPHRNQPLSQEEIEEQLKQRLKADRVVWLDHGTLLGDDTDGHIDTIVRTAPDDTLLYVRCDDIHDKQFADFQALEQQLHQLRTPKGLPYRLIPLPMPKAIYEDDFRLPATYANFVILNDAVMVPTYQQPDLDALAKQAIQRAFPGREVTGIDATTVIRQHGSLHCLTMQYPQELLRNYPIATTNQREK